jgi:hypothetical protein
MVYSESGDLLLKVPNGSFAQFFNTSKGTKIILPLYSATGRYLKTQVYSVPGKIYNLTIKKDSSDSQQAAFPNPATNYINISYQLPLGYSSGVMQIFDMSGKIVKKFIVPNGTSYLLDVNDLQSGIYFYKLDNMNQKANKFEVR